jgi:predicted ATPase/DNA-binding SARP family transcriptional activator
LEVWRDGKRLELAAAKPRALLGFMIIRRGEVARDVLIDALWGEHPVSGARNTLQVYVSRLRRLLGEHVIETTPTGYRLCLEHGSVDAEEFEALFRAGQDHLARAAAGSALAVLSEALALWRGPAFADLRYEAFAQAEAGRLDELRLACFEDRIEAELALGRHAALVGELESLVVEQPLRERLRGQLILALYRSGRQSEALSQYQAARRMLADELGLDPSPGLRDLERMILAHDPELAAPTVPAAPKSSLPLQPTPFIGREDELAEVVEILRRGSRRLVTLTGAGGSGKTRLAIEAARQLGDGYSDGVWWVPLQSLADPKLVLATIAGAIDAKADPAEEIGERRMLLLLDNFEQLLDAGPETAALLASCPNLTLLVTSRERLHVAAEREYVVSPMTEGDAVSLFDEQSTRRGGEAVVAEICRRIDCLPLAVELAAGQTRVLGPDEILARLDERLPLLTGGPRDAPDRQQTLRATIEWSLNLLEPEEQELFAQLGVFADGADLQTIQAVCRPSPDTNVLAALVDKSLLRQTTGYRDEPRYSMLQTIREYATEQLEVLDRLEVSRRSHAKYFGSLVDRAVRMRDGEEVGPDDEADLRILYELANLRDAVAFALAEDDSGLALTLLTSATPWSANGASIECRAWIRRVLERTDQLQTRERARVVSALGGLEFTLGNFPAGEDLLQQAVEISESCGDVNGQIQSLLGLVTVADNRGDFDKGRMFLDTARPLAEHANAFQRAQVLFARSADANERGAYERADRLLEEGLEIVVTAGIPRRLWSWQLLNLAWALILREDLPRARAALDEFLADPFFKPPLMLATAYVNLALVDLFDGDADAAAGHFSWVLGMVRELGGRIHVTESLYGLAVAAAMKGDAERSIRLWASAEALQESSGVPFVLRERMVGRYLEPARSRLDDDACKTAWAEGAAMTFEEAVAFALVEASRSAQLRGAAQ